MKGFNMALKIVGYALKVTDTGYSVMLTDRAGNESIVAEVESIRQGYELIEIHKLL